MNSRVLLQFVEDETIECLNSLADYIAVRWKCQISNTLNTLWDSNFPDWNLIETPVFNILNLSMRVAEVSFNIHRMHIFDTLHRFWNFYFFNITVSKTFALNLSSSGKNIILKSLELCTAIFIFLSNIISDHIVLLKANANDAKLKFLNTFSVKISSRYSSHSSHSRIYSSSLALFY